ncbi:4-hydroxy-tetrahydrodipicolinate synthase [Opitutales bacterium ASA1]|uniref:4-hydroxy-tetrahydrodipicolinate synthase n=1 Tax=Congregicoccus parvus TaxID=3081749 RepID=UPI002B2E54F1|nr:4-hydroxy-tetrahydrodipicolinate synthase [Opitutales bacterium ASA1]
MPASRITGVVTALVTPFRSGRVAFDELQQLVEKQIDAGVSGLVPVGTTGESPTLDHGEHIEVIRAVIEAAKGRVPVIAGTGSNSTAEAVSLTRRAHEAGADGFLQVGPYYNKPTQEGLYRHFAAVAEATDRLVMLYSIPGRSVIEIAVPTVARLLEAFPHVNHIKEAGGSCDRVDQLRQTCGDALTVLSGDDALTLPFMALGAVGVVSVASNLFPSAVVELVNAATRGDYTEARAVHHRLQPLFKALFVEPNPAPVKAAMAHRGLLGSSELRLPLCEMSAGNREALLALVDRLAAS